MPDQGYLNECYHSNPNHGSSETRTVKHHRIAKRICIIRNFYFGRDPRVRKEVHALLDDGWSIDLICQRAEGEPVTESLNGLTVHRLPVKHLRGGKISYLIQYSTFLLLAFIKLSSLHYKRRFDLVQINTMPDALVFSGCLLKLFKVPLVMDMHELMPELFQSIYKVGKSHLMIRSLKWIESQSTAFSDYVITVNEQCKKILLDRGVPKTKLCIVHNVPDDTLFTSHCNFETCDPNRRLNLFSHGCILKRYGFETLIKAVLLLKQQNLPVHLNIAGDGEYFHVIKDLANSLGVAESITFFGFVPFETVKQLIEQSDICIVCLEKDNYTDIMLPNKLFEYIAMDKPVISSNVDTIKHYFRKGEVVFFESGNANDLVRVIRNLSDQPEAQTRMVQKARETYQDYVWSREKKRYAAFLNNAINVNSLG
jgi:glycosyltransferase involved in cell wall biosynthesis